MPRCFVIQPFNEDFDRLYDQVFAPAVHDAGMEPYRVDTQPAINLPVENIEAGIRDSDACLAEISTDNPNVWYELGFAISSGKDVVIVCSDRRPHPLPFDVQHRNVFHYCSDADSDWHVLRRDITRRLRTLSEKRAQLNTLAKWSLNGGAGGLRGPETAALLSIAANRLTSDATVHPRQVRHDMTSAGFDELTIGMALDGLRQRGLLREVQESDARDTRYTAFQLTERGAHWLREHEAELRAPAPAADSPAAA